MIVFEIFKKCLRFVNLKNFIIGCGACAKNKTEKQVRIATLLRRKKKIEAGVQSMVDDEEPERSVWPLRFTRLIEFT